MKMNETTHHVNTLRFLWIQNTPSVVVDSCTTFNVLGLDFCLISLLHILAQVARFGTKNTKNRDSHLLNSLTEMDPVFHVEKQSKTPSFKLSVPHLF